MYCTHCSCTVVYYMTIIFRWILSNIVFVHMNVRIFFCICRVFLSVKLYGQTCLQMSVSTINSVGTILNFLVESNGWACWPDVVARFGLSGDFEILHRFLQSLQAHDSSFSGQHSDWIRPVYYASSSKSNAGHPDEVLSFYK